MKRTLLFVLALTAVGCADTEQPETPSDGLAQVTPSIRGMPCANLLYEAPLEDLRTCAEQGDAETQLELGQRYKNGVSVPEDYVEAVRWYRLAAEQGYAPAQFLLGAMYESGRGVPEDIVLAYMWYNLAAANGDERRRSRKEFTERQMTREQIAEGQRLTREWLEAHPPGGN